MLQLQGLDKHLELGSGYGSDIVGASNVNLHALGVPVSIRVAHACLSPRRLCTFARQCNDSTADMRLLSDSLFRTLQVPDCLILECVGTDHLRILNAHGPYRIRVNPATQGHWRGTDMVGDPSQALAVCYPIGDGIYAGLLYPVG
jgi:hypothetical protein